MSPRPDILSIETAFFNQEALSRLPSILAIFLGGSHLYSQRMSADSHADWDGIVIVRYKVDILSLLNKHRRDLLALLRIVNEEAPDFSVPEASSPTWSHFDAVRISGLTETHSKRSIKILNLEYFLASKSSLNILSYKDKRIYWTDSSAKTRVCCIRQATRLPSGLLILHDQLVYTCSSRHECTSASFGMTSDLIVSGICLYGDIPYGQQIKRQILSFYSAVAQKYATTRSFARHTRFSPRFNDWLSNELSSLYRLHPLTALRSDVRCPNISRRTIFFYGKTTATCKVASRDFSEQAKRIPSNILLSLAQRVLPQTQQRPNSIFSSNSITYDVLVPRFPGNGVRLFGKRTEYCVRELWGAMNAAIYYPGILIPHLTSSGGLLYPFINGITESELRMSFIRNGRSHWPSLEQLLYTEMVKAEDTLRAYRTCLRRIHRQTDPPGEGIQRFFRSWVVDNKRFTEFYGDGFQISGKSVSMERFLGLPWTINGVVYPSLSAQFRKAAEVLDPHSAQMQMCPVSFGLGDAHGGNVIISPITLPDNSREIIYVDYEVAGFHPIMLDLAKPFYNDVFFETLYADTLPSTGDVMYGIENESICVRFTPQADEASRAIQEIKIRFLIRPVCEAVLEMGGNLENHVALLSSALLLCATLTRNYRGSDSALFMNMATGIILSTANDWDGFYSCLRRLGFDA
ncbi:hypothetical protein EKO27_g5915 [Xylaria grammica]|uniref:Uncharacterized protein n=1 Tax=Xylaria grammica TaxID=363999 RepID=A0A439D478_9PEZI|nr:hypothetical protein EKO27_g5915 [Xylaria grammica]